MRAELPAPVEELVAALRNPITQIEFLNLPDEAEFLEPVLVDAETAARMVRPYSWFLDRVGADGIKLTSAGYLTQMLYEAGWASSDGTPVDRWQARDAATDTHIALVRLGALTPDRPGAAPGQPTPDGALFARTALRTWPA
jgi:hypothetical protein